MKVGRKKGAELSKAVIVDSREFESIKKAAEYLGINHNTLKKWLNGRSKMPFEYRERGLRFRDYNKEIKVDLKVENLQGEKWERIDDTIYAVSNFGRVKRLEHEFFNKRLVYYPEKILTPALNSRGYYNIVLRINGKKTTRTVHRLVAKAFVKNPKGYNVVNHIDECKTNNRADNLEWVTAEQNLNHGTCQVRRVRSRTSKIKKVYCDGKTFDSAKLAAKYYGLAESTLRNWARGRYKMPDKFKEMGLKYVD